ncbi:Serine/Threonine-kinase/endoribonuclease Ire1 [Ceratobasidium theobromae]|uniref:non-specific serine/threonine protein kinase n=1 Tax=Ceratobasidium theobromae TaxID=1582974 RepID=A0A5N5QB34_9AGAM|nr:Serine/Threonine-kinase/endoribonuclease Ire1 [Ceratobasidium theobromae]
MLPALIQLCVLAIIICAAAEPFRRSTHASLQRFSKDLATAKRLPSNSLWRRGERPPMVPHSVPGPNTAGQDIRLLDIVLAASIDGHFHALNRTTGELIWSMADDLAYLQSPRDPNVDSAPPIAAQSPLYNLVRSNHRSLVDSDDSDDDGAETYVVEPQTGELFVMEPLAPDDTPVERLGYTIPQLVELSPFKPPGDDDRVFIGKRTTSLISIDLLTGRILGVYGERCAWDDNLSTEEVPVDVNAILDDLDGTQELPKKQKPVEVVIGRTDYHVSVHVKGRGIVQNLEFTKYGPNNVHRAIQAAWTRSPDGTYFQPSPEGRLYSFANGGLLRFEHTYPLVVAIFDAVYLPTKRDPILLLQPTPKLSDLSSASSSADMDVPEVTYVGRIDDSLFALSHTNYPLVIFSRVGKKQLPRIDDGGKTPTSHSGSNHHASIEKCYDLDCLTGTRWSQSASHSGLGRLLEEAHIPAIEGSAGVEDPPPDIEFPPHNIPQSQPERPRTRAQPQTLDPPRPTRTTNSTSHARPHVGSGSESRSEAETPNATPSHRTAMRALSSEWIAAWASMGGVLLSTIMFGLGLGVRRGKLNVGAGLLKAFGSSIDTSKTTNSKPDSDTLVKEVPAPVDAEIDDDTPPPVPPKPYSISRITQNPYMLTPDSRPAVPPKDSATPKKRIRPRARAGLPASASVPLLPPGNAAGKSGEEDMAEDAAVEEAVEEAEADKAEENQEETEQEGPAGENTPGKKRGRRRRGKGRGKGASVDIAEEGEDADKVEPENPEETEQEGPAEENATGKKRIRRGRRGKGRGKGASEDNAAGVLSEGSESFVKVEKTPPVPKPSLFVSEEVLGYGSHGTVVYKGRFQGRSVAVKRLLHDFVTLASREVALLQESDDHPNVIRYYYEEHRENFLYIALELCPCSLSDVIERPQIFPDIVGSFDAKRALSQVTAGLKHLHALKIVHRDIKPQNILVSARGAMLISDFGLCRKLEVDQTSFMPTVYGGAAAGTAGWRAPEILRGDVNVDMAALDVSNGGTGSNSNSSANGGGTSGTRLTRSVDVFALGCLFFYVLSGGDHPYGDRFERDVNILRNEKRLGWLERLGEEGMEAMNLIGKMLSPDPKKRPDTTSCLMHPFFWNPGRRLAFLQDASDRFEIMERDPREPGLVALETSALDIVGTDWQRRLDKMFIDNLGKFRKYDVTSVQDLLRALRNKKNHYQDLPDNVKRHLGPLPEGFLSYFTRRFPKLFLHVYCVVSDSQLRLEPMFRSYFALEE